ncbi:MAG: PAS domain S-box protein [Asticcacaulis sp.]
MQTLDTLSEATRNRCQQLLNTLAENLNTQVTRLVCDVHGEAKTFLISGDETSQSAVRPTPKGREPKLTPPDDTTPPCMAISAYWPNGNLFGVLEAIGSDRTKWTAKDQNLIVHIRDCVEDQLALGLAQAQSEALSDSEERFRLLVENSLDDFFVHDVKGRILDVNNRACLSLGYTREELLSLTVVDLSTDLTQAEKEDIWDSTPPGAAVTVLSHHKRKDGTTFPVEVRISCHLIGGEKLFLGLARDITERIENEQAVLKLQQDLEDRVVERTRQWRETAEMLQAVADCATDVIMLKDLKGRFHLFNGPAQRVSGRSLEEIQNKPPTEVFGEEVGNRILANEQYVITTGQPLTVEETVPLPDGARVFLNTRTPYRDIDGNIAGVVAIARDITERKAAENELKIQSERLVLATQVGGLGIWDYNIADNHLYCDPQWYRIMGLDPEVHNIASIEDFKPYIHPEDVERATAVEMQTLSELLASANNYGVVFRIIRPNGDVRWVRSAACLIESDPGVPTRAIGVMVDITESQLAEDKLQRSYDSLRRAEIVARVGSWTLDLATGHFACSDMLYEMNGADPNGPALTPDDLQKLLPESGYQKVMAAIDNCIKTGESYSIDTEHMRPDGKRFAVNICGQAIRDADSKITALTGTVQDVSAREAARAQLAAIADSLPNGAIYRLDYLSPDIGIEQGEVTPEDIRLSYISAGIENLIGVTAETLTRTPALLVAAIHEDDRAHYLETSRQATLSQSVFECQFRLKRSDGGVSWLQIRSAPRPTENGRVWDGIILDVTKEIETAEALRVAKEAAESAEQAKGNFLATMSHEIRTPMNTVIGMTRLALQTSPNSKQRNYLEKIDTSARNLLGIINDILDFSKIEAGGLELEDTDFSMETLLESVSVATTLRAEEKGLEIVYTIAPDVPATLRGDPLRLSQVLINLVGNAVKFTHTGEIVVSVQCLTQGEKVTLHFSVRDSGIGMDPDQISILFRPFTQADSRISRRYGGTGLGLSICKQLVEKMGGTIGVVSQPGTGSDFHFTVVLKEAESRVPTRATHVLAGKRILIVDDNDNARDSLASMAQEFDMTAETVGSGPQALKRLHEAAGEKRPFEIVLMDWRMPEMDGLETARRIRADANLKSLPAVLMVTAFAREDILQQVETLELQGVLIKPVTQSMLFEAVHHVFGRSTKEDAGARISPGDERQYLRGRSVLVVDDNAFNLEVATDFLTLAGVRVDTASSGAQALERLERQKPGHTYDAVLMDMQMPEMDGLEATRRIRLNPVWDRIPIIALTAQARVEEREAILKAGMTAHITKPIDEVVLYRTLAQVVSKGNVPLLRASEPASATDIASLPPLNTEVALKRLGGSQDRLDRLMRGFLKDFPSIEERMAVAFAANNWARLADDIHLIKGTAGYLVATPLTHAAEAFETAKHVNDEFGMGFHAFTCIERLRALLTAIEAKLVTPVEFITENKADLKAALELANRLPPLLRRADFAANGLLSELTDIVAGHETAVTVREISEHFDNLEVDEALSALERFIQVLSESKGGQA